MDDLSDEELLFVDRWNEPHEALTRSTSPSSFLRYGSTVEMLGVVTDSLHWAQSIALVFASCGDMFMWERCPTALTSVGTISFTLSPGFFDELCASLDAALCRWQDAVRGTRTRVLFKMSPGNEAEFAFCKDTEVEPMADALGYTCAIGARMWKRPSASALLSSLPVTISISFGRQGYGAEESAAVWNVITAEFCNVFLLPLLETYVNTPVDLVINGECQRYCIENV